MFILLMWIFLKQSGAGGMVLQDRVDSSSTPPPNVLVVMFEDLRPELSSYGNDLVIAPTIERLAKKGVVFDTTIAQVGVCAPSRTSMLTGLRPDTLGVYDFQHFGGTRFFRSISSHFHRSGYQTSMAGKFQHWDSHRYYSANYYGAPDWELIQRKEMAFHNASVTPDAIHEREGSNDTHFFRDSIVADHAIRFIEEAHNIGKGGSASQGPVQPWFLAVGFKGTHMQYQMPKRFWDMYDGIEEKLDSLLDSLFPTASDSTQFLRFPAHNRPISRVRKAESRNIQFMRANATLPSVESESYFRNRDGTDKMVVSRRAWKELYRGYLASLTYADYQFGRLMGRLEQIQHAAQSAAEGSSSLPTRDTVVVFTADHGMHLGEKGLWSKWSLFEESTRVPLIIHDPRYPAQHGRHVTQPVELLDLFPTLVDLALGEGSGLEGRMKCRKDVNFGLLMRRREALLKEAAVATALVEEEEKQARVNISISEGEKQVYNYTASETAEKARNDLVRIQRQLPDELGDLTAIDIALKKEGKGALVNSTFRHIYCDPLEGISLGSFVRGEPDLLPRKAFGITQRLTCKAPGHLTRYPADSPTNASSGGWIEHCPNKKLPRVPALGTMGYSLRYIDYRYTAWLSFDVDSYLPALNQAPLEEELYYHQPGDNLNLAKAFRAELNNLAPAASSELEMKSKNDGGGTRTSTAQKLASCRKDLYDYLWFNSSFSHLFHRRLVEQTIMTKEMKSGRRLPSNRKKMLAMDYMGITHKRVPANSRPHRQLYDHHYFHSGS